MKEGGGGGGGGGGKEGKGEEEEGGREGEERRREKEWRWTHTRKENTRYQEKSNSLVRLSSIKMTCWYRKTNERKKEVRWYEENTRQGGKKVRK